MRRVLARALCAALLIGSPAVARGQAGTPVQQGVPGAPQAGAVEPGSELTVFLMTMGQGGEVWERFGHNAIWILDRRTGESIAYNWGLFDFNQPGFVPRFLAGSMQYWMDGFDADRTIAFYRSLDRAVYVQELALTPRQRASLRDFVRWNQQPEHKFYHYDYFRDNCSTRVRDALDRATGGMIRAQIESVTTNTTYRSHTKRLTQGDVPVYTGIMAALGEPADRPINAWEESFLPMRLREHLRRVRVPDGNGGTTPLVITDRQVVESTRPPEPEKPSSYVLMYLIAGVLIAGLVAGLWVAASHGARAARGSLAAAVVVWSFVVGLVGVILLLAWTVTQHVFWYRNENLLAVSPLLFLFTVLGPLALRRRASRGVVTAAAALSIAVAVLSIVAVAAKVLPSFSQRNAEILAAVVPVNLALAWVFTRRATLPSA